MAVDLQLDNPGLLRFLCLASATRAADEMEIFLLSILFGNIKAFAVLPDVTSLAGNAMCPIIDLPIDAADAVKYPVVFLVLQLL